MSENGWLDFYGAEHSKCNHMITVGFKGLKSTQILLNYRMPNHLPHEA